MTRLTRYVLVSFLQPLFIGYSALSILVLLAELMDHLDKFIAGKAKIAVVVEYLILVMPVRSVEIFPVAGLLAVLFCLGNLTRRREITAALAGGIHPWRCVRPILMSGLFLSLFCWGVGESIVPYANRRAHHLWDLDIRHLTGAKQTRFDRVTAAGEGGNFLSIGVLDVKNGLMENVVVDQSPRGWPARQIQARRAEWTGDSWIFKEGTERVFDDSGALLSHKSFSETRMSLKDKPQDLAPPRMETDDMSYKELKRRLSRLKALGVPTRRHEVDLQMKLALPWANLIVILVGISFSFQKSGGKVRAVGLALGTAFFYFGLSQVGRALGQKEWCPPTVGAWLANLIFLSAGGWGLLRLRKLS